MLSSLKRALPGAGLLFACTVAMAQATLAPPPAQAIATVVKVSPLPWFDRRAQGVRAFEQSTEGVRAHQYGHPHFIELYRQQGKQQRLTDRQIGRITAYIRKCARYSGPHDII